MSAPEELIGVMLGVGTFVGVGVQEPDRLPKSVVSEVVVVLSGVYDPVEKEVHLWLPDDVGVEGAAEEDDEAESVKSPPSSGFSPGCSSSPQSPVKPSIPCEEMTLLPQFWYWPK